jgi:hypothetical protein
MSKSGFEDEVLIKLIVGVVKHVTIEYIYSFKGLMFNMLSDWGRVLARL